MAEKLKADLPQSNYVPIHPHNSATNSIFLYPVSPDDYIKIISSLNNTTCGINNISRKLLKSVQEFIALPLCELINSSFSDGIFSNIKKKTCVTTIYKNGNRNMINNFLPISVVPVMRKVIQKCMYKKLNDYFTKVGIISSEEFFGAISNFLEYIYIYIVF